MALSSLGADDEKTVQLLLRAKANPDLCGTDDIYPLEIVLDKPNFLKLLLQWKCDVNLPLSGGHTALHRAIAADHMETVQTLVAGGANLNAATQKLQRTPLFFCTKASQVFNLLDIKADPFQVDSLGQVCAHKFAQGGEPLAPCLYAICSRTSCDVPDHAGYTPLGLASSSGNELVINMLLDFGHDGGRKVPSICALQHKHYSLFFKLSLWHIRHMTRLHRFGVIVTTFLLLFGIYIGTFFVMHYSHPGRSQLVTTVAITEVVIFILVGIVCAL